MKHKTYMISIWAAFILLLIYASDSFALLNFVEIEKDGVGGVDGLNGAYAVAVSKSGNHVYVAGSTEDSVAVFSRNKVTGELGFVEAKHDGADGIDGLGYASSITISPDDDYVYVTGFNDDAVAVFSRNSTTGALTFVEVQIDDLNGVNGLDGAHSVVVSPNGNHLYVGSYNDNAIAVFSRNISTGALTFVEAKINGTDGVEGLNGARSVAISPYDDYVYAGGYNENKIAVFSRDSSTGELTFVEVQTDGVDGVNGLNGVHSIAFSPDGDHIYAAGSNDDAIAVFSRNETTGELTFEEVKINGSGSIEGLNGVRSVTVSPYGDYVYAASEYSDAVVVFSRDKVTGGLSFIEAMEDGVNGVNGIDGAFSVVVSPDGAHIYVAGNGEDAVAVFEVNEDDDSDNDGDDTGDEEHVNSAVCFISSIYK